MVRVWGPVLVNGVETGFYMPLLQTINLQSAPSFCDLVFTPERPLRIFSGYARGIALPSPDAHLETGLPMCPPEKSLDNDCNSMARGPFSGSGLSGNNCEILALFAYFGGSTADTPCSADLVAAAVAQNIKRLVRFLSQPTAPVLPATT